MTAQIPRLGAIVTGLLLLIAACGGGNEAVAAPEPTIPAAPTATDVPPTAVPTETPEPTPVPEPPATPVPPTPTPEPTATPEPTPVPPTATATPIEDPTVVAAEDPVIVDEEAPVGDSGEATADTDDAPTDPDPTAESTEPGFVDPIVIAQGSAVFTTSCADCHGAGGSGTGQGPSILGIGQFFPEDASPLTGLVTNGGTNMPEFGTKLTTEEIDAVVQYVVATFQ